MLWYEAEIVAVVFDDCVRVAIVKLPVDAPAGISSVAGTVAAAVLLLSSVTEAPPAGAGPLKTTVPIEAVPPVTAVGFSVNDETIGDASTVTLVAAVVASGKVALSVTLDSVFVATEVIAKVALVVPAGTSTLVGTTTNAGALLLSITFAPPAGAGALSCSVPVADVPPSNVLGDALIEFVSVRVTTQSFAVFEYSVWTS